MVEEEEEEEKGSGTHTAMVDTFCSVVLANVLYPNMQSALGFSTGLVDGRGKNIFVPSGGERGCLSESF